MNLIDNNENVEILVDAETVKNRPARDSEEYLEAREEKYKDMARKREKRIQGMAEAIVEMEENNNLGVEAGIGVDDLPPNSAGRKLTQKQRDFCKFFVATHDIARSLQLAGYQKHNSKKWIKDPAASAYIAELTDKRLKDKGFDRYTTIETLMTIANQDIKDYMDVKTITRKTKDGQSEYERTEITIKDFDAIDRDYITDEYGELVLDSNGQPIKVSSGKTKAIKQVKYDDNGRVVIEFYDKMSAIKEVHKLLGVEDNININLNDETKRAETEKSILNKLKALVGDNNENKVEDIPDSESEVASDKPEEA